MSETETVAEEDTRNIDGLAEPVPSEGRTAELEDAPKGKLNAARQDPGKKREGDYDGGLRMEELGRCLYGTDKSADEYGNKVAKSKSQSHNPSQDKGCSLGNLVEVIPHKLTHSVLESTIEAETVEGKKPGNAALVFIYNEETGEGFFERKPWSYGFSGHENKLAFVGGHIEPGESPYKAACREVEEEVSEGAAKIIVKHIDPNRRYVGIEYVDGIPVKNWVFESKIPMEEWAQVKYGHAIADAGDMVIKPLEEIAASKGRWAFYHYDLAMKFIRDFLHYPVEWTKSHGIEFKESYTLFGSLNLPGIHTTKEFKPAPSAQLVYAA